jgi:hypothetical protein
MEQILGKNHNMEQLIKFISGNDYSKLIENLKEVIKIEVNENLPSNNNLNHDISRLKSAKLEIKELVLLIESEKNRIIDFIVAKLKKYNNVEDIQEYPKGEELEKDEKDVRLKVLPYYKNFIVLYLIEFYLLKNNPSELESYLKSIRISNAKKYEKELKEIYSKL